MQSIKIAGVSFLILSVLVSLTACGPVAGNYPKSAVIKDPLDFDLGPVLFEGNFYKILEPSAGQWFDGDKFQEILDKQMATVKSRGASEGQMKDFGNMVKSNSQMQFQMKREGEKGKTKFAFGRFGMVFGKRTVLTVQKGAFKVAMTDPKTGEKVEVADVGMLMPYKKGKGYSYLDTKVGTKQIRWKLQEPDYSKNANIVYFRLPLQYKGWKIESVSVNPDLLSVGKIKSAS